jgi:hypothetical protein
MVLNHESLIATLQRSDVQAKPRPIGLIIQASLLKIVELPAVCAAL